MGEGNCGRRLKKKESAPRCAPIVGKRETFGHVVDVKKSLTAMVCARGPIGQSIQVNVENRGEPAMNAQPGFTIVPEMQWEIMSGKGRWIVSSNPFLSYDVVVCNNSRRAVKSILQKEKAEKKKNVSWPPDLISKTERDVAAICSLLESSDDTVQRAFNRFKQLAQRGDPIGRGKQARLYNLAVSLYYKGMAYIFRTPRRLLEHLARSEKEHIEGMFKSEASTPKHKSIKADSALLRSKGKPRSNRTLTNGVKSLKSKLSKTSHQKSARERDSVMLVAVGDIKGGNGRESKLNLERKSVNKKKRKRDTICDHREAIFGSASDCQAQKKIRAKNTSVFGMLVDERLPVEGNRPNSRVLNSCGMLVDEGSAKTPAKPEGGLSISTVVCS
eukprot:CAMPEP_0185266634 /NCGR_PEP_ID=MMETSP1359-20130426/31755_1 /TAXON_ID=552665 /ORGANISM="Bigelowiella longifila, Strain CCMP242" /LENGTH=386 /DNA_ID=CAMNT_0027856539 /DNA_START=113 /DNA_END=1272 /DNA_ORIENTATION=+